MKKHYTSIQGLFNPINKALKGLGKVTDRSSRGMQKARQSSTRNILWVLKLKLFVQKQFLSLRLFPSVCLIIESFCNINKK